MKRMPFIFILSFTFLLFGCARPFEHTPYVLNEELTKPNPDITQSKITVHRALQIKNNMSGDTCKFLVLIDDNPVAALAQNRYVVFYLNPGVYKLKTTSECEWGSMGLRKTLDVVADGTEQEYETELGFFNQFRMWRTK